MTDDWEDCILDDFDVDDDNLGQPAPRKPREKPTEEQIRARACASKQRSVMRRAMSEQHMNEVLDWHLEDGCAYHCISGGDVDFLTYMRGIVKAHRLDYLLCSTWCMAMEDAQEIGSWLSRGMVGRADVYVGEIFIQHYMAIFEYLADLLPQHGGRLCMQRNHAKVMVGFWHDDRGELHGVAVTSSANINTNPRIEQAVITVDTDVAQFYKAFFDSLKPKNPWPIPWGPWEAERCPR